MVFRSLVETSRIGPRSVRVAIGEKYGNAIRRCFGKYDCDVLGNMFIVYYWLKMANSGLRTDSNTFSTFSELSKCSPNLDPWTPYLLQKYCGNTRKSQIILKTTYFHISQHFGNPKEIFVGKYGTPTINVFLKIDFVVGQKQSSISIVLNKNGKQDGGISINLKYLWMILEQK